MSLPPGMAGARVTAVAEPKVGYTQETAMSAGLYDSNRPVAENPADADPFTPVDYRNLDDIVVWIEPAEPSAAPLPPPAKASPVVIDVAPNGVRGRGWMNVVGAGGQVRLENRSARPVSVFLRSAEEGGVTDVGAVPPGGGKATSPPSTGLFEVVGEAGGGGGDEVLAQVYVAPTASVERVVHGKQVTFAPLPPGRYVLRSWHPRLPGRRQTIELTPDKLTDATIAVGVNALPKVP